MHYDLDKADEITERINRIRDHVPREEFDINAAVGIAIRELGSPWSPEGEIPQGEINRARQ